MDERDAEGNQPAKGKNSETGSGTDPRNLHVAGDRIGRQLQTISILTREVEKDLGAALGINLTDLAAMEQLISHGPLPPTDMAARLKVTTAGMTQIIDRLERAGHVVREKQRDDKRRVLVRPLPDSVSRTYTLLAPMLQGLDALVQTVSAADRAVIETFLDRVIAIYRSNTAPGEDSA
ncbi:MAG: MarR family winged helix-turn-helix transcriptional regulator [Janthinobacterium lividum]